MPFFFVSNASAGYGARIFIQSHCDDEGADAVLKDLHALAKELSVWRGSDKRVIVPAQDIKGGFHTEDQSMLGYEVEAEELALLVKRCNSRPAKYFKMHDVTPILKDMKMEWH